jgi:hypothetical protein
VSASALWVRSYRAWDYVLRVRRYSVAELPSWWSGPAPRDAQELKWLRLRAVGYGAVSGGGAVAAVIIRSEYVGHGTLTTEPGWYADSLDPAGGSADVWLMRAAPNPPRELLGVQYYDSDDGANRIRGVVIPLWVVVVLFAALPGVRAPGMVRRRHTRLRARRGLCPRCGYDLTGNVSGVCPECGAHRFKHE